MEDHEVPIAAAFAARLRELRAAAGLTLPELGARVEPPMLGPAVARYESGKRVPTWTAVVRLAVALGVSPDEFLPPDLARRLRPKRGRGKKES